MSKKEEKSKALTSKEAGVTMVKEHKEVTKAATKKERTKLTAPPAPPTKIGDVVNPIIGNKNLKRAMAVAIVNACTRGDKVDETKACMLIRMSGIPYKSGYTEEAKTDTLTQNEWSGRPYARFVTNTPEGKAYEGKHPEKVKKCEDFAKALKHAFDAAHKEHEEAAAKAKEAEKPAEVAAPAPA